MDIKVMKLSIVAALIILAIGSYSWYRYTNRDVITIGSLKSSKELELINDFGKYHKASLKIKDRSSSYGESDARLKSRHRLL